MLAANVQVVARGLFWRYKGNAQPAMERAKPKVRRKDVYDGLVAEWLAWDTSVLPELAGSDTNGNTGDRSADRVGATTTRTGADDPARLLFQDNRQDGARPEREHPAEDADPHRGNLNPDRGDLLRQSPFVSVG